jgi:Xaa-Pro dipeptidase
VTLPPHLARIVAAEYPRFSADEMALRRGAIESLLAEAECDHLLFCGANRFGSAVQWLTQWPVTAEAVGVLSPGQRDALFVQYVNHAPQACLLADQADVAWGGESSIGAAIKILEQRGACNDRVATIGPLNADQHAALSAQFGRLENINRDYVRLRQVKSPEELNWLRIGAHFSDRGMTALRDGMKPGMNDRELGDAVVAEISAAFWDHPGQVLRTFALGEPSKLYHDLHAAADAAFDAIAAVLKVGATPIQVIEASSVIEDAGFTIIDDLLHGYGGGYLPPILGSKSRPAGPIPQEPFRAGQTVVIQPNVTTHDGNAGVQTGEMVLITELGIERLHSTPRGFHII